MKRAVVTLLVVLAGAPAARADMAPDPEFFCADFPALVVDGRTVLPEKRLCVPVPVP